MKSTMQFFNVQFVAVYERNKNVRERIFEYEKALKSHFKNPFRSHSIPDDVDPNYPRFDAESGYESLSVNQERLTYSNNIKGLNESIKIREIVSKRINILKTLLLKEKISFIAYIIELHNILENENDIFRLFKEGTQAKPLDLENLKEFSIFYAKPHKNEFFLNINCARYEQHTVKIQRDEIPSEENKKSGISIVIDLNTRYLFNKKQPFYPELFNELENETFEIISKNELKNYLSGEIL